MTLPLPARVLFCSCLLMAPSPAQGVSPLSEANSVPEVAAHLDAAGRTWQQFLTRSSLSCGVYRLEAGAVDGQPSHDRDEVYYVVSGKAVLEVEDRRLQAVPGAVLFVAAGADHRFVDIESDLTTLVFFSTSVPSTGGMAGHPQPTEQTPYDESSARGQARIFYWHGSESAGQLVFDYGRPAWRPGFVRFVNQSKTIRWRFGQNFWTTLDTNIPLTIGGVDVPVGHYYAVLENHADHGVRMVLLDPDEIRKRRLDAWHAPKTAGGLVIPLVQSRGEGNATRLEVQLQRVEAEDASESSADAADLIIQFGPLRFAAPVQMHPVK